MGQLTVSGSGCVRTGHLYLLRHREALLWISFDFGKAHKPYGTEQHKGELRRCLVLEHRDGPL